MIRRQRCFLPILVLGLAGTMAFGQALAPPPDKTAAGEAGWEILFDGKDASQWTGGIGQPFPSKIWRVENGCLRTTSANSWVCLYSTRQYRDFDLRFEWRISLNGNSGVKYQCVYGRIDPDDARYESIVVPFLGVAAVLFALFVFLLVRRPGGFHHRGPFFLSVVAAAIFGAGLLAFGSQIVHLQMRALRQPPGFEYQMVDNANNDDALKAPSHKTAALYDLFAPVGAVTKPVGEFNDARILVQGNRVEHWLNGKMVVAYELGSPELRQAVARSKFARIAGFAGKHEGYLMLQNHHSLVWFRNIRVRRLDGQS